MLLKNILKIDNLKEENLKIYYALSEPQLAQYFEPRPGLFIAESPKVVAHALFAGYNPVFFKIEETQIATLAD